MATAAFRIEEFVDFGSAHAREQLVEGHFPLVKYVAGRLGGKLPPSIETDDLVGAGLMGLIDAADKFDPERGIRFRTYAERRIRGAIIDHLRSLDWAPRSLRRRAREVETAHGWLERERNRSVSVDEVAAYLDVEVSELHALATDLHSAQVTSLTVGTDGGADGRGSEEVFERVVDSTELSPFAACERAETREALAAAVEALPEKERLVVSLYYVEELTMKEIGATLGVNESRVSQLHSKAVQRLRATLNAAA